MTIRVQQEDFNIGTELATLTEGNKAIGGLVSFVGLVRDMGLNAGAGGIMMLEHYAGMTEKELQRIEVEANMRWSLESLLIIHRYGCLQPGDRIVLVAVSSAHRKAAFKACEFLIDQLKIRAPFWKKEITDDNIKWVKSKKSDKYTAGNWSKL